MKKKKAAMIAKVHDHRAEREERERSGRFDRKKSKKRTPLYSITKRGSY